MTRNQRRKASKAKQLDKSVRLAHAERNMKIAAIVRDNLSRPIERNYYPPSSYQRVMEIGYGRECSNIARMDTSNSDRNITSFKNKIAKR